MNASITASQRRYDLDWLRRFNLLRFLFGMKLLPHKAVAVQDEPSLLNY
jgi:hypothetical protein